LKAGRGAASVSSNTAAPKIRGRRNLAPPRGVLRIEYRGPPGSCATSAPYRARRAARLGILTMARRRTAEENEARGNPGRRRKPIAPTEILPPAGTAPEIIAPAQYPAPLELSRDAKRIWERYAPDLARLKLLRRTDELTFGQFCEIVADAFKAKKTLDAEGYTYESESAHGRLKRIHPAYIILDRSRRLVLQFAEQFGMTPAARAALMAKLANAPNAGEAFGDPRNETNADGRPDLFGDDGSAVPDSGPLGFLAD
jgi:P27 family predicted phage terminase small subunit